MKDIAKELGVSMALVSVVLSGRKSTIGASEETKEKILRKAQDLGYVPNRNAAALASGKTGTVGVFLCPWGLPGTDLTYSFLRGLTERLNSTGYHTWLTFFEKDAEFYEQMKIQHIQQRVDGIVTAGPPHHALLPYLRRVEKAGIPVIVTCFDEAPRGLKNVFIDRHRQGQIAIEHLLAQGCRKIVHFYTHDARFGGFREAMRTAGLSLKPENVVKCDSYDIEAGREAVRKLLQSKVPFDGITAESDHQAIGAMRELLAAGLRIPEDVRVIGVDDGPICLTAPVPLTSITTESYAMGATSVDILLKKLAKEPVKSILLEPRLVKRDST